jgi:hypothetical protein
MIHRFNTYMGITATKAKPFTDDTQADILLSGITTIDDPAARNLYLDVTSTNPRGSPTRSSSTVLPFSTAGPGRARSPQRRPHLRKARVGSQTPQVRRDATCAATGPTSLLTRSRRRAGTGPLPRRCSSSSPRYCATRVRRQTCSWASSTRTSRLRFAGARLPQ